MDSPPSPPLPRLEGRPVFRQYIALGDSMSIDDYPGLDHAENRHLTRPVPGLGAASLLFRNDAAVWPEFRCRDLSSLCPGIVFTTLAADGATTLEVLMYQVPQIAAPERGPVLITLTAGGNDLLGLVGRGTAFDVDRILESLSAVVGAVLGNLPDPTVVVATVYDPTDGLLAPELPLGGTERGLLARFNAGVRRIGATSDRVLLADLHKHFAGHGAAAPEGERWFWRHMPIEPSLRGASEVRRQWLQALGLTTAVRQGVA